MTQRPVLEELYDLFYRRYGRVPKETLLDLMRGDVEIERLRPLSHRELWNIIVKDWCIRQLVPIAYSEVFIVNPNHGIVLSSAAERCRNGCSGS